MAVAAAAIYGLVRTGASQGVQQPGVSAYADRAALSHRRVCTILHGPVLMLTLILKRPRCTS